MPTTFLKRDFNTPTLQSCKIFKETYFEEQLRAISSEKIPMKRKKLRNLFIGAFIKVVFMITVYEAVQFLFIFIRLYHFSPSLTYFKGHIFVIHSSFRSYICERFLTVKVHKKTEKMLALRKALASFLWTLTVQNLPQIFRFGDQWVNILISKN